MYKRHLIETTNYVNIIKPIEPIDLLLFKISRDEKVVMARYENS